MKIRLAGSCLVASLLLVAAVRAQSTASADEYTSNPKFQAALKEEGKLKKLLARTRPVSVTTSVAGGGN